MTIAIHSARLLLPAALLAVAAGNAMAQGAYPNKPIRWIVANPPGGPGDIVARTVGQKLSENLGQQVLVDNRPGVAGQVGTGIAAKAPADGYTLVTASVSIAIQPALYENIPYDATRDFAPITLLPASLLFLVAHPSMPARSPRELIALAKARPDQITYASSGSGSPHHLGMEILARAANVKMIHVPYKGAAPAVADLIGGQVSVGIVALSTSLPHVKSGKLHALGITSPKRSRFAPEVPTIAESGFPGYAVEFWMGVLAPAGTPQDIVNKLNGEIVKILQTPETRDRFHGQGFEIFTSTPQEFAAYLKAETAKWTKVARESGAKAD